MLPRSVGSLHLDTIDVAAPVGAPVLCLHGLFAGSWVFQRFLPLLAARGHPAAALSFRDHTPSPAGAALGRHRIADYADDASEAARALGRPLAVGHSLGGLVALMLAARGLVSGAVLLSSAPPRGITVVSTPLAARMWRYAPAMLRSRPFKPSDDDLDALVLNRVPGHDRAALRDRLAPDSGRAARDAAVGAVRVRARDVRVPLLVVSGDEDRFVPLGVAQRIARRFTAPLQVARGHGHFLFAEPGWEAQARVMLDWIDANQSGA